MLHIVQIEEIEGLLLQLPRLVQQQEERSIDFVENTTMWLCSLEDILKANHLYQAGSIATLRSTLIAAKQGHIPEGLEFRNRPTRNQIMSAVISQILRSANDIVTSIIATNKPRLNEAEQLAWQIINVANSQNLIPVWDKNLNTTQYLSLVRHNLETKNDLENAVIHLEGLVGKNDALILLDRALTSRRRSM